MSTRLTKAEWEMLRREAQPIYGERFVGYESPVVGYVVTPQLWEAIRLRVDATIEAERNARKSGRMQESPDAP